MKTFEISSKKNKNGRRKFKAILYKIFPDSCIDEANEVGTDYNENGITWIREYCEKALPSIEGMSLRCEFLDSDRTELCGHGDTDIDDGLPVFENAVVIGTFKKGYIDEVEDENGETYMACIGEGEIDAMCYNNFTKKLDEDIANGYAPNGSIEIYKTDDNDGIVYKYGYKEKGRIPMIFEHSGYALLGVKPADENAKILELNSKEEKETMTEAEIKALIEKVVNEMLNTTSEIDKCKEQCETEVAEAEKKVEEVIAEKNEINATVETLQAAVEDAEKARDEANKKYEEAWDELTVLRQALAEAKVKEKLGEFEKATEKFSDEEKEYAKSEIEAFKEAPQDVEINSVVNKIWEGIGKKAKEVTAEQNSKKTEVEDIFSEVVLDKPTEDVDIF